MSRPNRRRALTAVVWVTSALSLALAGCSSSGSSSPGSSGPVTVTFWNEAAGPQANALSTLVAEFNAANKGKITVQASFEGTYADAQTKYTAAVQSGSTPSLIEMNDISTGFMADSGQTVPVSQFAYTDSSFDVSDIPGVAQKYYGGTGGLLSMPFAVSEPVLYLNPKLVEQAGLNPADPPTTLAEIAQWAQQIKDKTGGYGMSMNMADSWILEELTASGAVNFCNPDNGRGSARATSVTMTSPTQIAFLTELQKLFEDGAALNPGTSSTAMPSGFTSGKIAMLLTSSGSYTTLKSPGVQVDVAAFPFTATSPAAGAVIGGASLWIDGPGHNSAEQQAAYEFAKFLNSAQSQAAWSKATGYLAANNAAKQTAVGKATLADPNVAVMYKQLSDNPASPASSGCRMGAYPTVRADVISGFEKVISGASVTATMTSADQQADQAITQYNSAVK